MSLIRPDRPYDPTPALYLAADWQRSRVDAVAQAARPSAQLPQNEAASGSSSYGSAHPNLADQCARYRPIHSVEDQIHSLSTPIAVSAALLDPHAAPATPFARWMVREAQVTRAKQVTPAWQQRNRMISVLDGLGKHAWDLESYLGNVTPAQVLTQLHLNPSFREAIGTPQSCSASSSTSQSDSSVADQPDTTVTRLQRLASWFRSSYMKWIDPILCPSCSGSTSHQPGLPARPTTLESSQGGGRVELHRCNDTRCAVVRRFVRYNSVETLLQTREGRCGEWAHLFYAILRVLKHEEVPGWEGVEVRYVWNSEDHVWVEVWSEEGGHWVHVDPCEAAVDKPLLYDQGWGKKQAFCIAIGSCGAEDVTKAYVSNWRECLARRKAYGWKERMLDLLLLQMTISLRVQMSHEQRIRLDAMDASQAAWVAGTDKRIAAAAKDELGGRESGTEEWRRQRDEMGAGSLGAEQAIVGPDGIRPYEAGNDIEIPKASPRVTKKVYSLDDGSSVYLLGTATRSEGKVLLTNGPDEVAGFFPDVSVPRDRLWTVEMKFTMDAVQGGGADGMALVFTSDPLPRLGCGGFGMGYDGLGSEGDWAVEIDTYRSQDHADDPPTPHISLHSPLKAHHRYSRICTKPGQLPDLTKGQICRLRVLYDLPRNRILCWLSVSGSGMVLLWATTTPAAQGGRPWRIGVAASCGGLWQRQDLLGLLVEEMELE